MTSTPSRLPRFVARPLAVLLGLVVGLAAVEAGLRVAAYFQLRELRAQIVTGDGVSRPLVAFVGDSNIFGLYMKPEQTLPKCLERLSRRSGAKGVDTANFAVPGSPSWKVLEQAKRALELKPDVLVARCGINNYSMIAPGEGLGWLEDLRIVKTARRAIFNWKWREATPWMQPVAGVDEPYQVGGFHRKGDPGIVFGVRPRDGGENPVEVLQTTTILPFTQHAGRLKSDIFAMADLAQKAGARFVLATYLAGLEPGFNAIRGLQVELDGQHGIVVSDCTKGMSLALFSVPADAQGAMRARLLTTDQHPTAAGYEVEARVLARTLKEMGVIPDYELESPLVPLQGQKLVVPKFRRADDAGEELAFEVEGDAKDEFRLLIGAPGTSKLDGIDLPLNANPFLRIAGPRVAAKINVTLGESGKGRIEVPTAIRQQLKGPLRAVCLVTRGGKGTSAQTMLTPVIDLQ